MARASKLPPFGKQLVERQHPPFLVFVCAGAGAWDSAKERNQHDDALALVLPAGDSPGVYTWPVRGCLCVIEWRQPASRELIVDLVKALLMAGAEIVTVWPRWPDYSQPSVVFDVAGQRWVQQRETIRTYHPPRKESANVLA